MNEPPINPTQQPLAPQQSTNQQAGPQQHSSKTDVLGILSIIFIFIAPLIGLILGLVGQNKAKKEGYSPTLSTVGWIVNLVLVLLVLPIILLIFVLSVGNFDGAQAKARDTQRISDINSLHSKLEEFYNENEYYPSTFTASTFPGADSFIFLDPSGQSIKIYPPVKDEVEADQVINPTSTEQYMYVAFPKGCVTDCVGYVLKAYIEVPNSLFSNPYRKEGLNNPF